MQPKRFRSPIESQQAGSNRMSWLDAKMSTEAYPSQIRSVHKRAPPNVRPSVETSHHHLEHTFPGRRLSVVSAQVSGSDDARLISISVS
jgi:hypothetical protein